MSAWQLPTWCIPSTSLATGAAMQWVYLGTQHTVCYIGWWYALQVVLTLWCLHLARDVHVPAVLLSMYWWPTSTQ